MLNTDNKDRSFLTFACFTSVKMSQLRPAQTFPSFSFQLLESISWSFYERKLRVTLALNYQNKCFQNKIQCHTVDFQWPSNDEGSRNCHSSNSSSIFTGLRATWEKTTLIAFFDVPRMVFPWFPLISCQSHLFDWCKMSQSKRLKEKPKEDINKEARMDKLEKKI